MKLFRVFGSAVLLVVVIAFAGSAYAMSEETGEVIAKDTIRRHREMKAEIDRGEYPVYVSSRFIPLGNDDIAEEIGKIAIEELVKIGDVSITKNEKNGVASINIVSSMHKGEFICSVTMCAYTEYMSMIMFTDKSYGSGRYEYVDSVVFPISKGSGRDVFRKIAVGFDEVIMKYFRIVYGSNKQLSRK